MSTCTQQCLFLVTAFVFNSIQIAPLHRTTQHIFCKYERKNVNIKALYCLNQKCSVVLFFKPVYIYHKEIIDYHPFTTLCMSYASCALPSLQTEINKCCYWLTKSILLNFWTVMIPPYFQLNRFLKVFINSNFIVDRGIYTPPKKIKQREMTSWQHFLHVHVFCMPIFSFRLILIYLLYRTFWPTLSRLVTVV